MIFFCDSLFIGILI